MSETKYLKFVAFAIVVMMFLPFVTVSCEGQEIIKSNNLSLAIGMDQKVEMMGESTDIPVDVIVPALVVLVLAVAGLIFLVRADLATVPEHLIGILIYLGMFIALLLLPAAIRDFFTSTSEADEYVLKSKMQFGYYLTIILSVGIVAALASSIQKMKIHARMLKE